MKVAVMASLYGSRAEENDINKMINSLDSAKIEHNYKDMLEEKKDV